MSTSLVHCPRALPGPSQRRRLSLNRRPSLLENLESRVLLSSAPIPTTTTITLPGTSAAASTSVTANISVAPASGSLVPTGTVTIRDGVLVIGSAALVHGAASFTDSTFISGTHELTVFYSGDSANQASASPTSPFTILPAPFTFPTSHQVIVTAPDIGAIPFVQVFDATNHALSSEFLAYDAAFPGAVRVASGDVNNDGYSDIVTATGPGGQPLINVFDGKTGALASSFYAYPQDYLGGVEIAVADVLGTGNAQIITSTDAGGQPIVNIFDSSGTLLKNFFAYSPDFLGGVHIAATTSNYKRSAFIITDLQSRFLGTITTVPASGGSSLVNVFDAFTGNLISNFYAADASHTTGFTVAVGDVNSDGVPDIILGNDVGAAPTVRVFDGATRTLLNSFNTFDPSFLGGISVAAVPTTINGFTDSIVVSPGPNSTGQINIFDPLTGNLTQTFNPYSNLISTGINISAAFDSRG